MRHAGMNNFMAIDIHTLTNRKSYGHVGNGFISGGKKKKKNEEFHSNYLKNGTQWPAKVIVGVELKYVID